MDAIHEAAGAFTNATGSVGEQAASVARLIERDLVGLKDFGQLPPLLDRFRDDWCTRDQVPTAHC